MKSDTTIKFKFKVGPKATPAGDEYHIKGRIVSISLDCSSPDTITVDLRPSNGFGCGEDGAIAVALTPGTPAKVMVLPEEVNVREAPASGPIWSWLANIGAGADVDIFFKSKAGSSVLTKITCH